MGIAAAKFQTTKLPPWSRAASITLPEDAPLNDTIATVIGTCRDHWQANAAIAADGRDPEGVHQVRVALRRLRSALGLFKDLLPAAQRAALAQEAKWLLTELGPVRDLDVFINTLSAEFAARIVDDEGYAQLIRAARTQRDRAQTTATAALRSTRSRRFNERLDVWLQGRGWQSEKTRDDAEPFARQVINRRLRKIKAAAEGVARLPIEERHELRIAVKKARYGIEFFATLLPAKRAARWTTALKHVQDSLGHMNDLDVAERTIARLVGARLVGARLVGTDTPAEHKAATAGRSVQRQHKKLAAAAEPEIRKQCRRLTRIALF